MAHPLSQPKIVHGIPGRLRVRVPSLQTSPDLKAALEAQMKATPAVETVRISHATDSIIINYRPQEEGVTQTQIYQLITQITQEFFAPKFNHQTRQEMVVSETNGKYREPTVALEETANSVTDDTAITQPKSLIPDPEPAVIATELTDATLAEVTNDISSTTATQIPSESLIPDPEPAVIATELTDTTLAEVTNDISSTTATQISSESLIPDPEPAVIATELTELTDEVSSTATTEITPERASTPPPAKTSRRTSPRKPRTRKKPEPPANS